MRTRVITLVVVGITLGLLLGLGLAGILRGTLEGKDLGLSIVFMALVALMAGVLIALRRQDDQIWAIESKSGPFSTSSSL